MKAHKTKLNTFGGSFCTECFNWSSTPDGLKGEPCLAELKIYPLVTENGTNKLYKNTMKTKKRKSLKQWMADRGFTGTTLMPSKK